jgi:hypothetical protein
MEVSSAKILGKMDELVQKAKQADSQASLNGYVMAIQALCDVLGQGKEKEPQSVAANYQPIQPVSYMPTIPQVSVASTVPQVKPIAIDEANGDSLFDF